MSNTETDRRLRVLRVVALHCIEHSMAFLLERQLAIEMYIAGQLDLVLLARLEHTHEETNSSESSRMNIY